MYFVDVLGGFRVADFVPDKNALVRKECSLHPSMNHPISYELLS
jgi:hypothetical protein